jgi:hypothetical protein
VTSLTPITRAGSCRPGRYPRSVARTQRLLAGACALVAVVAIAAPAAARDDRRTLSARSAIVRQPREMVTRLLKPIQGCHVLLDNGTGSCAVVQTAHGYFVFTVEPGPFFDDVLISRPWIVRVYRSSATVRDGMEVALETRSQGTEPGPLYANVTAKVADVTGDGKDELVLGYRSEGTGQLLDVDIVGTDARGTPKVLAHDELYKGTVEVERGRLVTYAPVYGKGDGNCCPTWIERDVVRYRSGAFRVERGPRVPTKRAHVPPGDLG